MQPVDTSCDILMTGATSFVGRNVLPEIAAGRRRIVATHRGTSPAVTADNVEFCRLDITDADDFRALPKAAKIILHFAAASSNQPGAHDIAESNILGTLRLIDYARRAGAEKLIFASSMTVYGDIADPVVGPDTPIRNPSAYGISKRMGEMLLAECAADLPSVCLRLPAVLAPGAVRHWPARVVAAARTGGEVRIYNSDAPFNNVLDTRSLASFINQLCDRSWRGCHVFPVSNAGNVTVREAALTIAGRINPDAAVVEESTRSGGAYLIDNRKAESFGFAPATVADALTAFAAGEAERPAHAH